MMHTLQGPARRIAVVEIPRGRNNRLGRIGSIREYDWNQIPAIAPLTDEPYMPAQPTTATGARMSDPPTSAAWMAEMIRRQSDQRESTPGTLTYTPAPPPQPGVVARWNSWAGPCLPSAIASTTGSGDASSSAAASSSANGTQPWPGILYVAAALGAAASAAYLLNGFMGGRK